MSLVAPSMSTTINDFNIKEVLVFNRLNENKNHNT